MSGWKSDVRRGHERDAADPEAHAAALRAAASASPCRRAAPAASPPAAGRSTISPGPQRAAQEAEGVDAREVAGRDGEDRAGAGADRARSRETCSIARERGGRGRRPPAATPGWRGDAARRRAVAGAVRCRPGPASRAGRCAPRSPVIVRSEWPTKSSIAPSSADRSGKREHAHAASGPARARARRARAARAVLSRSPRGRRARRRARPSRSSAAATSASWVATTSAKPSSSLQRVDQVEHALAGVRVEVAGRLVAEQQLRLLGERARDRDPLRLAAGQLAPAGGRASRRGRRARAARRRERGLGRRRGAAARRRRRSRTP